MRDEEREHGGRSRVVRLSHEQHQGDHEQPRGERHGTEMLERGEQTPIGRGDRPRRRLSRTIGPNVIHLRRVMDIDSAPHYLTLDPFHRKEGFGREKLWVNGLPTGYSARGP